MWNREIVDIDHWRGNAKRALGIAHVVRGCRTAVRADHHADGRGLRQDGRAVLGRAGTGLVSAPVSGLHRRRQPDAVSPRHDDAAALPDRQDPEGPADPQGRAQPERPVRRRPVAHAGSPYAGRLGHGRQLASCEAVPEESRMVAAGRPRAPPIAQTRTRPW